MILLQEGEGLEIVLVTTRRITETCFSHSALIRICLHVCFLDILCDQKNPQQRGKQHYVATNIRSVVYFYETDRMSDVWR